MRDAFKWPYIKWPYIDKIIKRKLFPHVVGAELEYKFNKLAMYRHGSNFSYRQNSTVSSNNATLLIGLNSKFEGGDVVFKDSNLDRWTFNESDFDRNYVPWCAFHSDTWHAVEPVTSGVRAVLQFDVSCKSENPSKENLREEWEDDMWENSLDWMDWKLGTNVEAPKETTVLDYTTNHMLLKELIAAVGKYEVNESNATAIPLQYKYRTEAIVPKRLNRLDFDIFNALLNAGYKVALQPIEIELTMTDHYLDAVTTEGPDNGESFKVTAFNHLNAYYSKNNGSSEIQRTFFKKSMNASPSKVTYVGAGAEQKEFFLYTPGHWGHLDIGVSGWMKYFSGAMVIFK